MRSQALQRVRHDLRPASFGQERLRPPDLITATGGKVKVVRKSDDKRTRALRGLCLDGAASTQTGGKHATLPF